MNANPFLSKQKAGNSNSTLCLNDQQTCFKKKRLTRPITASQMLYWLCCKIISTPIPCYIYFRQSYIQEIAQLGSIQSPFVHPCHTAGFFPIASGFNKNNNILAMCWMCRIRSFISFTEGWKSLRMFARTCASVWRIFPSFISSLRSVERDRSAALKYEGNRDTRGKVWCCWLQEKAR